MALTVEQYTKLSASEKKQAMKGIEENMKQIMSTLDAQFDRYINHEIPNKIMTLNQLSQTIPTLFTASQDINVNIVVESSTTQTLSKQQSSSSSSTVHKNTKNSKSKSKNSKLSPPRKRRKFNDQGVISAQNSSANEDSECATIGTEVWYRKSRRTASEIARLETNVSMNESMHNISNMITKEVIEIIHIVTAMKMSISLKIPSIQPGDNFGVEIQEEIVDDLGRSENGALDAIDQIAGYYQIRSKAISKILKWPYVEDYKDALQSFDLSHLATLKSMVIDLRNSYIILHDTITKNMDKLKRPRDERAKFYMY
eukprot:CAMPEP_0202701654 /NCGR_PEP_ID=MMETSP1385-20130828/14720_1 /ASSEMBLY_ACC=CAM_ASM_000861 /TAXON_ID=933848 /ORGANISM="Elphidium margaritaceum" /LENGTH=312 /DNA_ID=CAMNT_0049359117 /DNA_START=65 /DNA_END=1003 /DNA_ORIENTATION=+